MVVQTAPVVLLVAYGAMVALAVKLAVVSIERGVLHRD